MKKFMTPECEMIALEEKEIIVTSGAECLGQNEGKGDCDFGFGS